MFSWILDPRFWISGNRCLSIDRPIFLLGLQGGGLTLLTRMLRRQGQIVTGAGGKSWWTGPDEIQNIYGPWIPADLGGLRWKAPPHPLFGVPRSWSFGADTLYSQYRRTEADLKPETRTALLRVIQYSLARYGGKVKGPRFLDKSQTNMLRVGFLYEALKESEPQFVLMPRDPYVSVWRAATGKARDMQDILEKTSLTERLKYCAQHYSHCMEDSLSDAERLGFQLHILTFEQLIKDPTQALQDLCTALGLSFDHDMVPSPHHHIPFASRFKDRWYPIRTDVNAGYFSHITPEAFRIVNSICSDLISRLGYQLRHGAELDDE
jgi:hypothetical protein